MNSSLKHSILCVDDEIHILDSLKRTFRKKYHVLTALSGSEGLAILSQHPSISVIISDQRMPQMEGVEFLAQSMKTHPESIRILLTGYTDIESVIGAINAGRVYQYINKPWTPEELTNIVDKAVERFELNAQLKEKNEALQKALDELKTLDEAKNHFMLLVSHELKTPLTLISSFAQLLHSSQLNENQKKYLQKIMKGVQTLESMIQNILELISAQTSAGPVEKELISVSKIFSQIQKQYKSQAQKKNQTLQFSHQNLSVKTNYQILYQVLTRLLDNAVKFAHKDSQIDIQALKEKKGVWFWVQNQGKPLNESQIENILKPFVLDEDILHHSKGLGLGLSLSQALLKQQGSSLDIQADGNLVKVSFFVSNS